MAEKWTDLPINQPLFANLDEDAVVGYQTALENAFVTELGGVSRFPGLIERVSLGGNGRVFLYDFNDDLIAANDQGSIYRIDRAYNVTNVTGIPISGGRRPVFAKSDRDLGIAAGGPILRFRGAATEIMSEQAPIATHIGWIDNFWIAVETNSGRFYHCTAGTPEVWDPLDSFSADGNPDNINTLLVTPFRELLLCGQASIEQFERLQTAGDVPFFRRWAIGDGVKLPYGITFADNGVFAINSLNEWVRMSGQQSESISSPIGKVLEKIDDWTDAWMGGYPDTPLNIIGQKFIVFQAPFATTPYGTKGITIVYDNRGKKFFFLYGWDAQNGVPKRWAGWSHWRLWDKTFVGGEGKIYELTDATYRNGDELQRWLLRTAHMAAGHQAHVKGMRIQIKRGLGTNTVAPTIRVRCSRDNRPFGSWVTRSLGLAGERTPFIEFGQFGIAYTFQFEISCADDCAVELIKAQVKTDPIGQ